MRFFLSSLLLVVYLLNAPSTVFIPHDETGFFRFTEEDYYNDEHFDRTLARFTRAHTISLSDHTLKGVYVRQKLQSSIEPQPPGEPAYVSLTPDVVTEFSIAMQFGSIGLLAHNTLAGKRFDEIRGGDEIVLVYGDGSTEHYTVADIRMYQALDPFSPYSSYVKAGVPGDELSVDEMFMDTFGIPGRLILQTCISENNIDSWGRLFIIATVSTEN